MTAASEAVEPDTGEQRPAAAHLLPRDPLLWVGLLAIALVGAALRFAILTAHLPTIVAPDEPTTVGRAMAALEGQLVPPTWDWPPLAAYALAVALRLSGAEGALEVYAVGRALFAGVSVCLVVATGALGAVVATRHRRAVAWGAATVMAVSYVAVRNGRTIHPEQLQTLFAVVAVMAAVALLRTGRWRWLVAAGVLAGLGGATKYLAALAVVPLAIAILLRDDGGWRRRLQRLTVAAVAAVGGFVGGVLFTVRHWQHFVEGLSWQFLHQAGGHLGYEAAGNGLAFHLGTALPGTWGWLVTVAALAGVLWAVARGRGADRLLVGMIAPILLFATLTDIRFPHYTFVATPFLAVLAFRVVTVWPLRDLVIHGSAALLALSLVPTLASDVRLLRATGSPDTRELALAWLVDHPGSRPVVAEVYTAPAGVDRYVYSAGAEPGLVDCGCVLLLSRYQEERYRRRPDLYAAEIAGYDALRAEGTVLTTIRPFLPLSYRWDVLPQWGMDDIPLTGEVGPTGPAVTVLDLRG